MLASLAKIAGLGASFRDLHDCWSIRTRQLGRSDNTFVTVGDHLAHVTLLERSERLAASAPTSELVTLVGDERGFWQAMAQAIAPASLVGTMTQKVKAQSRNSNQATSGTSGQKRKSNRAVLRDALAKTQREKYQRLLEDLDAPAWPQWDALIPEVKIWVCRYRPQLTAEADWAVIQPAFIRLFSAAQPATYSKAQAIGVNLVPYLKWAVSKRPEEQRMARLEIAEVGTLDLVNEWVAFQRGNIPEASLATRRSEVGSVIRALHPASAPIRLSYQPVAAPYQRMEIKRMCLTARFQSEDRKAVQLASMIALCAGVGLQPKEVGGVRPSDLQRIELPGGAWTYLVEVRVGNHPRSVPMLQQYAKLMEWVLQLNLRRMELDSTLLPPRQRGVTSYVVAASDTANNQDLEILATRLRTTWLVTLMQADIPLATLLTAAGLTSARTLGDLMTYCDPISDERALTLLAQADGMGDQQVRS